MKIKNLFSNTSRSSFALVVLFVSLLIIYWPGFSGDWYLDDFGNIHDNPNVHLKSLSAGEITKSFFGMDQTHSRFNRPLAYLSLALNHYFGGTEPLGYHVVNFCIHNGTAFILFLLTLNILKLPALHGKYEKNAYAIALLATLLWATHPIQVNAVTYIVQRMAALAGLFTVLSLYCYLKARVIRSHPIAKGQIAYGWYAACVFAGACAVASKQNAAMLPFSLIFLEILLIRLPSDTAPNRRELTFLLPAVVILILLAVIIFGCIHFQAGYHSRPFSLVERMMTQPRVICFYLGQLFYPFGSPFALLHDFPFSTSLLAPWTTLPAILLLAGIVGVGLRYRRKWPLFSFGTLFFFLNHVIESSMVPLELIFEHRNYLPSFFFFLLPAIVVIKVSKYFTYSSFLKSLTFLGLIVWIIGQAHTTYMQNILFQNPILFWSAHVKLYPNLHRPRHNLAKALLIAGLEDEAEKQMYQSLDGKSSARIHQKYITSYNLGVYYLYRRQYQQALEQFAIILKSNPHHSRTLQKTAELYLETGHKEKARQLIDAAIVHNPQVSTLHVIKGFVLLSLGKIDAAFEAAARAETLKHGELAVNYIRGEGYRLKGEYNNALKQFEKINTSGRGHYATLLALLELYYLTDNSSRMDQTLAELERITEDRSAGNMLASYNRRWNFVGQERMANLTGAMHK